MNLLKKLTLQELEALAAEALATPFLYLENERVLIQSELMSRRQRLNEEFEEMVEGIQASSI